LSKWSEMMFGNNIKELRKEKGLTQTQLAQAVGVTQGAIYFWEKDQLIMPVS